MSSFGETQDIGFPYTAPSDGIIFVQYGSSGVGYLYVSDANGEFVYAGHIPNGGQNTGLFLAKKDVTYVVYGSGNLINFTARFTSLK